MDTATAAVEPSVGEKLASAYRAASLASDGKPEGSRESLVRCARMLDTYAPELYPAAENGQVHFARAMMQSVADSIRAYIGAGARVPWDSVAATPLSDDAIVIAYAKRGRDHPSFMCDLPTTELARESVAAMHANPEVAEVIGVFTLGLIRGNCDKGSP